MFILFNESIVFSDILKVGIVVFLVILCIFLNDL